MPIEFTRLIEKGGMLTINENPFELAKALSGFHYINGDLVPSVSGKNFPVKNPTTMIEIGAAAEAMPGM